MYERVPESLALCIVPFCSKEHVLSVGIERKVRRTLSKVYNEARFFRMLRYKLVQKRVKIIKEGDWRVVAISVLVLNTIFSF